LTSNERNGLLSASEKGRREKADILFSALQLNCVMAAGTQIVVARLLAFIAERAYIAAAAATKLSVEV
jgi:hypothetical protein